MTIKATQTRLVRINAKQVGEALKKGCSNKFTI